MKFLADRLELIKPSPSLAAMTKAKALMARGVDVCNLTAGEPEFETPAHIVAAAHAALLSGDTKYTAVDGTHALKQAICDKFRRENGLEFAPEQISVGAGAKQVLYNVLTCTVNEGDEVLIPAPCWVSYPDIVRLNGGRPIFIEPLPGRNFKISPSQLADAITPRTKWLLINSPNNPSGAVYTERELRALGEVLEGHPDVHVITDDVYEYLVYDDVRFATFAQANPKLFGRSVTVNAVSKAFAMTGWRLGYAAGPAPLIKEMATLQSQTSGNPAAVSQAAAIAALQGSRDFLADWKRQYQQRRDLVVSRLDGKHGLRCPKPDGAFFVYVSCDALMGTLTPGGKRIETDSDLVMYLLEEHLVAAVQGSAYRASPAFRLSFAASVEVLDKACDRILQACATLTRD
jgi:aspartate aminotransferase